MTCPLTSVYLMSFQELLHLMQQPAWVLPVSTRLELLRGLLQDIIAGNGVFVAICSVQKDMTCGRKILYTMDILGDQRRPSELTFQYSLRSHGNEL